MNQLAYSMIEMSIEGIGKFGAIILFEGKFLSQVKQLLDWGVVVVIRKRNCLLESCTFVNVDQVG